MLKMAKIHRPRGSIRQSREHNRQCWKAHPFQVIVVAIFLLVPISWIILPMMITHAMEDSCKECIRLKRLRKDKKALPDTL